MQSDALWLTLDAPEATLPTVGGKGASLARLARVGLPVPPGSHLTTAAYRHFVHANHLEPAIAQAIAGVAADDPAALERAAAAIRLRFEAAAMPAAVAAAAKEAYAALGPGDPAVAVRSSATAEDLPGLSFAGQQESFLNLRGEAAVLAAVRDCWASLWTARAIGYRARLGVDQRAIAMAVVVQAMVPTEVAGVLFTADPTTGGRGELLVEASFGLGEAVVSGRVTPDRYRLAKGTLAPRGTTLGGKELLIAPAAQGTQGTTAVAVPDERRGQSALAEPMLRELGELAKRVETEFGGVPLDIEWAVADGRPWLLQARPLTALPPAPLPAVRWEPPIAGTKWVRRQVVENMPEPLSPLFAELYVGEALPVGFEAAWSVFGISVPLDEVLRPPLFATINGYAYMGINLRKRWRTLWVYLKAVPTAIPELFRVGIPYWRDVSLPTYQATVAR